VLISDRSSRITLHALQMIFFELVFEGYREPLTKLAACSDTAK